jgi:hypothetical protein
MQLTIHVSLLLGFVAVAAALVAWRPGCFPRPTPSIVVAVVPFLLIGAISLLLLEETSRGPAA